MSLTPILILHIGAGSVAILCGAIAVSVAKGARLHRVFGTLFVAAMLVMAVCGVALTGLWPQGTGVFLPLKASAAVGVFAAYLVATGWMTVRRKTRQTGAFEIGACLVALGVAAALALLGLQAMGSPTGLLEGAPPAPYFIFASLATFTALLDLKVILQGGLSGVSRIARHLWRMCFAFFFAASFFFIGQQKVMPAVLHRSPVLLALGLAPLAVMLFWLIRVRVGRQPPGNM